MVQVLEVDQLARDKIIQGKYFIIEMGKSCSLKKEILAHLQKQRPNLKEVHSADDCNVILVFCPIVSRAGTDIDAALNKLNTYSASKPAIFMVLHLTFDPDKIVPDSSRYINRTNTLTVDCLFSEDEGLLTCDKNKEALAKIVQCFKSNQKSCLDILTVDCLFSEDKGLLTCDMKEKVLKYIEGEGFEYQGHLEMNKWYISLTYMMFKYLLRLCRTLAGIWNYFTGRETHESSTSNKRNRPKDTDQDKNV